VCGGNSACSRMRTVSAEADPQCQIGLPSGLQTISLMARVQRKF
jgi:hypothetical protein